MEEWEEGGVKRGEERGKEEEVEGESEDVIV